MTGTALGVVRLLYDAWNSGGVARAANLLAPDVRWENFGDAKPVEGLEGLHVTLAGPATGGTMMLSPVVVDLLIGVGDHVVGCTRRTQGPQTDERSRVEVWTVHEGKIHRYRGYPFEEGLAVLTESSGSRHLERLCRDLAAFNRHEAAGWPATVAGSGPDARLDDVELLTDSADALVVSAVRAVGDPTPLGLVLAFEGDRIQRVSGHPTAEAALAAV
jgi:ketosteroid isomerase-like protein